MMMNNKGPPITAAFSISEKSYHHPKIPATQTHFLLKMDSPILNKFNFENECSLYSRMPLIREPTGQKNLALLTGDRINEGFIFTRKCMAVLLCGQKKVDVITRWPYYRGLRKAGFHCIAETIIILLLNCGAGTFYCLSNLLCYVIWWLYPPTKPINFPKIAPALLENNNSLKIFGAYFPSHLQTWHQMKNDPRSCERNLCNC